MKIKLPSSPTLIDKSKWHEWFAWHPIICEGHLVWFKLVERQQYPGISLGAAGSCSYHWRYRFKEQAE